MPVAVASNTPAWVFTRLAASVPMLAALKVTLLPLSWPLPVMPPALESRSMPTALTSWPMFRPPAADTSRVLRDSVPLPPSSMLPVASTNSEPPPPTLASSTVLPLPPTLKCTALFEAEKVALPTPLASARWMSPPEMV